MGKIKLWIGWLLLVIGALLYSITVGVSLQQGFSLLSIAIIIIGFFLFIIGMIIVMLIENFGYPRFYEVRSF